MIFIGKQSCPDVVSPFIFVFFFCFYKIRFLVCAETEQGVAQAIIRSFIDFKRDPWPKISDNAKDLVKKMLNPDPKLRLTAQQVLGIVFVSLV